MAAVQAVLVERRNNVELPGGLVEQLTVFAVDTLKVREVAKDLPQSTEEWAAMVEQCYETQGETVPSMYGLRLKRWCTGGQLGTPPPPSGGPGVKSPGGGAVVSQLDIVAAQLGVTPASIEDDFDVLSITTHTREKAFIDMKAQSMLPCRIFAMSLTLETGRVQPYSEVEGMTYGSDIRATSLVKDLRKAKVPLLSKAIEEKNVASVLSHINGVIRDLSAHHYMNEAALVSGWMQEWTQMFTGDDKMAIAYLTEYFRVYAGRGLPTPFDITINASCAKADGWGLGWVLRTGRSDEGSEIPQGHRGESAGAVHGAQEEDRDGHAHHRGAAAPQRGRRALQPGGQGVLHLRQDWSPCSQLPGGKER